MKASCRENMSFSVAFGASCIRTRNMNDRCKYIHLLFPELCAHKRKRLFMLPLNTNFAAENSK